MSPPVLPCMMQPFPQSFRMRNEHFTQHHPLTNYKGMPKTFPVWQPGLHFSTKTNCLLDLSAVLSHKISKRTSAKCFPDLLLPYLIFCCSPDYFFLKSKSNGHSCDQNTRQNDVFLISKNIFYISENSISFDKEGEIFITT